MSANIVIAGGGMSGLVAACTALEGGANVTLVEKGHRLGGSMRLSSGYLVMFDNVNSIETAIPDGNPLLQELVVSAFPADAEWLASTGVQLSSRRTIAGRHGHESDPSEIISCLEKKIVELGGTTLLGSGIGRLTRTDGRIVAVDVHGEKFSTLPADAVVLATGGFQGNTELLARLCHLSVDGLYHRANPWSTGDGLLAALEAGAATSRVLKGFYGHAMAVEPATVNNQTYAAATQYQGCECVAINMAGHRFADESEGTGEEVLNQALAHQPGQVGFYVGDQNVTQLDAPRGSGVGVARILERTATLGGIVLHGQTIEELCAEMARYGANSDVALKTLRDYQAAMQTGTQPPDVLRTGNRHLLDAAPFWAVKVRPGITFTTGGLAVDHTMRVLERSASSSPIAMFVTDPQDYREVPIDGLFACGADVGGVSGSSYAGGLATALVTGRQAGRTAARHALRTNS